VLPRLQEDMTVAEAETDFSPILIQEIELSQPLPVLLAYNKQNEQTYQGTRCLIRLHAQPLGLVDLTFVSDELSPCQYMHQIWQTLGEQINKHLQADGLSEVQELDRAGLSGRDTPRCVQEREIFLKTAPFASVVISTRERPDRLRRCLSSLLVQQYPDYEVVVVDNAPATSATADLIAQEYAHETKIRYVRENRPGLSAGRNRGIVEARGKIVAVTDDDVVIDRYWLAELARGFNLAENVGCVTGLLLPLELETPAQFLLEAYSSFTEGFARRFFDLRAHRWRRPSYPYIVGACTAGTGACMAFSAEFLEVNGGFDPALGTGTPAHGGEDLAAFLDVITKGYCLIYEPAALLYHQHHRDYAALQRQMYGYGVGFTAYLARIIVDRPARIFDCIFKLLLCVLSLLNNRVPKAEKATVPQLLELKRLEMRGRRRGPGAYLKSRCAVGWWKSGLSLAQASARMSKQSSVDELNASQHSLVERTRS
jgi:GT2 family glycosyltransferase